ncbi:hypothetical protein Vretimale_7480 [Volvox reticuliferus]|uniref:Uncharacterized protein n=1 Tax=Volvox reticuliferus TaxID=1737510 RepID=A0A8J4G9C0_9CHLO|nr:hypothetical protein Vretifemale_7513 [Volvox reticuliferus]GIM02603.1 hypothetical protein Vretimale_7480 [Volvox reticuliferus]
MEKYLEDSASSLEDSEDLDDIPLSLAPNGRHEHDEPPLTSKGPPLGFSRPGTGFNLKLPTPKADELGSPDHGGLQLMRSEPAYFVETARARPPMALSIAAARAASTSYNGVPDEGVSFLGRRGSLKPPMLSLVNPASASPVPSAAPTPGVHDMAAGPPHVTAWPVPVPTRRQPVRVDLVSSAFVLQGDDPTTPGEASISTSVQGTAVAVASSSERIAQRCSAQLGIAPCDLEFFELQPLESGAIPESCTRVGVLIRGSSFSLSALEDLLARSKRDSQLAGMLEGAIRESSQHAVEAKQHAEKLAKQNEELAVLRERLRHLEAVNQHLRDQLQRSDEHRQLLGSTIRTIKKEFEDFKSRVVVEGSLDHLPLQQLSLGPAAAVAAATAGAGGAVVNPAGPHSQGQIAFPGPFSGTTRSSSNGGSSGDVAAAPASAAVAAATAAMAPAPATREDGLRR